MLACIIAKRLMALAVRYRGMCQFADVEGHVRGVVPICKCWGGGSMYRGLCQRTDKRRSATAAADGIEVCVIIISDSTRLRQCKTH